MKKAIALILCAVMCLSLCACGGSRVEGRGFKSPEDALLAYADALKKGDANKAISTFAVESYVENYDMEAFLDYIRMYPPAALNLPDESSFSRDINLLGRQNAIAQQMRYMYGYIALGDAFSSGVISFNGDPYSDADDFLDDYIMDDWMETLSEMEYEDDFTYPDDLVDDDDMDSVEETLDRQSDIYGCDELVSLALEIELDGEDYLLCMDVACYDGKWYNLSTMGVISAYLGSNSMSGGLCKQD